MLAASSRLADSLPEPAHSANALRDVLRRCANAMSISSNTCSRKSVVGRPRRGLVAVDADQARVHPRDRPEHRRRHHAVAADVAEEPDLGAGHAVVLAAGLGGQPLGDLGLHHHHDGADRRELGEQVQQRGHGDVVRQVRDQRGRLLGQVGRTSASRMSRLSTVSRLISLCECSAMVCGSWRASTGSISTAVTLAPRSSSASVSEPRPGPTSRTWSCRLIPEAETIRRTVLASWTKFWPKDLRGRKSSLFRQVPNLGPPEQSNSQRRPHSPATHGPRTPTLTRPSDLSNRDLFFTCCQICPREHTSDHPVAPRCFDQIARHRKIRCRC